MAKKPMRPCPCDLHNNALVSKSVWHRHVTEMTVGTRARWEPDSHETVVLAEPDDLHAVDTLEEKHSVEVVELVARGVINVTGAQAILKVTHKNYAEQKQ